VCQFIGTPSAEWCSKRIFPTRVTQVLISNSRETKGKASSRLVRQPAKQVLCLVPPVKICFLTLFISSDFWFNWLVHMFNMVSAPKGLKIKSCPMHHLTLHPRLRFHNLDMRGSVKICCLTLSISSDFWFNLLVHTFNTPNSTVWLSSTNASVLVKWNNSK
jgi:hypothetical protein